MATRFYFSKISGYPFGPTHDASWEVTNGGTRKLLTAKGDATAEALQSQGNAQTGTNSPAGAVDVTAGQWVSKRLSSSATISGSIKGYVLTNEEAAAGDWRMQCVIRVIAEDGTVRGTLVSSDTGALSSEFVLTTLTNRAVPRGSPVTPTSVAAQVGDRIVVEMGARKHENAATLRATYFRVGAPSDGSDVAENETDTTDGVGWIEFTENLSFNETDPPSLVQSSSGVVWTTGAASPATLTGVTVGNCIIIHLLQDGVVSGAPTFDAANSDGIENLAGTDDEMTQIGGTFNIGSGPAARHFLFIGRAIATTVNLRFNFGGDDMYYRSYEFADVNTGTALTDVIENTTAGSTTNTVGLSTGITDAAVETIGVDRLALNFVGVNDDNAVDPFTGMTGGTWAEAVFQYATATGTDACIQLQTAAMAAAGTIDGGSYTMAASDSWGVVGFALIGTTVAPKAIIYQPAMPTIYRL